GKSSSPTARFTFTRSSGSRHHAGADACSRVPKKGDRANHSFARPAIQAGSPDEKDAAADRSTGNPGARADGDGNAGAAGPAIGSRSNTDAALLGIAGRLSRDFDYSNLELSFLSHGKFGDNQSGRIKL